MKTNVFLLALMLLAGCSSGGAGKPPAPVVGPAPVVEPVAPHGPYKGLSRLVAAGLSRTSVAAYGSANLCPGSDRDPVIMAGIAGRCSTPKAITLVDSNADWKSMMGAGVWAAADLPREFSGRARPDTTLVLYDSGHGGQLDDQNGDEADSIDESSLFWSENVRDDDIWQYLNKRIIEPHPGQHIVCISDRCFSEGNIRALMRAISLGKWGKRRQRSVLEARGEIDAAIIQISGSEESRPSYGSKPGGEMTLAFEKTWRPGITWRQWYEAMCKEIKTDQKPQWTEYGNVTDEFRNRVAFQ